MTTRRWDFLAFGDPCADVVLALDAPPRFGEKLLGRALGTFAGGTTANAACAFSKLGGRAAVFGCVGDDLYAGLARRSLGEFGVDMGHLSTEPASASASVIAMVPASGDRAIVYMPMAPRELQAGPLAAALRQSRLLYAMPYDLDEFAVVSRLANECGTLVAVDIEAAVAPDREAMLQRIDRADIAFFNESGFRAGTGQAPSLAALSALLGRTRLRAVVVTLGAAGAIAASREGQARHGAFVPPTVADTTGAGDTFNAAFLLTLLEGQSLESCVRFACAAAGHAVTAIGARSGMPDRAAVERTVRTGTITFEKDVAC